MTNKTKRILAWIPSVIAATLIGAVASAKLSHLPQIVDIYAKMNLISYLEILGSAELLFMVLFLVPGTMKIGFLLLTAYFGGDMAVEFSHGQAFIFPAFILMLIWIAAYLREPSLFTTRYGRKRALTNR